MPKVFSHRTRTDPFVRFPREILEHPELSLRDKGLLAWLLDKADYPGGWETDVQRIAAVGSDGPYGIRASLENLERLGYLKRIDLGAGGRGRRAEWHVTDAPKPTEKPEVSDEVIPIHRDDNAENRDLTPHYRETSLSKTKDASFAAFWNGCLRKEAKRDAEKAFVRALKRADGAAILAGWATWNAHWVAEHTPVNYIPHPATWLNGDRWNDVPAVTVNWDFDDKRTGLDPSVVRALTEAANR